MDKLSIIFDVPLVEGIIQKRNSQFTMTVKENKKTVVCHCPTTERIGNIELSGRPCLLSKAVDTKRKTPYTVEALSLNKPDVISKSWIGINQNAVNCYVEHFLSNGAFAKMTGMDNTVYREQFLGNSKLDFLIGNTYLEVKTPLQSLQVDIPDYVKTKKGVPFSSTDRFVKHIAELANSLQRHQRAILLICFLYNNPGFQVVERSKNYEQVREAVDKATVAGVETWQANFRIMPHGVILDKYFKLTIL